MGSATSKLRKHLTAGDEVQALQLYRNNGELRKALDPNCSYGDSHQHETPLHLASKHGMITLLKIFLFNKNGNPNKTNARKETCVHCVCMESNSQSVHVCNRRTDCLNALLKWRGATLSEGQVEKVQLQVQDEKLNTALHYAAASGLTQCVEILVQHGAPLFIENEDNLTPCDTAEKNGHAQIAVYLESKMVFSTDDASLDEVDNLSIPPVEEYSGLRPQDLQEAKDQLLVETADMLSVPLFTAEALLRNHEWSRETLLEVWMRDPVACCEKCGVTVPASLYSDKPQVQENLASPLPSPLHATPSPLDVDCDICANTFLLADEPVHMPCLHKFCKDCWERYLNLKIQEGDAHHITCPAFDCCMLVPVDIIEGIVSRDMALRYLQFDIKAFVDSNPDIKWCPFPECGRAVRLPDLDTSSNPSRRSKIPADTSRGVDCGVGHYFCWECLEESHEPCSCDNWKNWAQKCSELKPETLSDTEQNTELAANCLWLVTNSKPCPVCKSPIQKNEGCNHMKCSKCKYDFCWVCLEQWKRHNSSTGGYFKCNRYEVVKKVEEESANLLTEAEEKNKRMQELNRFVHYYTRFKNHENSFKLEEPLLKTAKDKMMKLAEAVTEIEATAQAETQFVSEAVNQLLKARRVLKASYVYGFYLDGPGYKKIVFEFMQTELEECTEILSQMVNRLYLRTPRRKIMDQASVVHRKRLEFIIAIAKGLVPPETPPAVRRARKKRKQSGDVVDEDLNRAIMASIQEVDPANPWIKDASGRHTNMAALLEWPSDDSEDSEPEVSAYKEIGKCHRATCNRVRVRNPRTNEMHDFCSHWCMLQDKEEAQKAETDETQGISEIVLDEHMELLRALEMSRLQYLQDSGLLCATEKDVSRQTSQSTQTSDLRLQLRGNSSGTCSEPTSGLRAMEELGVELQRFQDLSSPSKAQVDKEDWERPTRRKSHKVSQRSRFNESKSTVVVRVPNKSVEDLYGPEHVAAASGQDFLDGHQLSPASCCLNFPDLSEMLSSLPDPPSTPPSTPLDLELDPEERGPRGKSTNIFSNMFGAIKDISVSNILAHEDDKTKDFLNKDLASIFAQWDLEDIADLAPPSENSEKNYSELDLSSASSKRVKGGKNITGKYSHKHKPKKQKIAVAEECYFASKNTNLKKCSEDKFGNDTNQTDVSGEVTESVTLGETGDESVIINDEIGASASGRSAPSVSCSSLQELAEDFRQITEDVDKEIQKVDKEIEELSSRQTRQIHGEDQTESSSAKDIMENNKLLLTQCSTDQHHHHLQKETGSKENSAICLSNTESDETEHRSKSYMQTTSGCEDNVIEYSLVRKFSSVDSYLGSSSLENPDSKSLSKEITNTSEALCSESVASSDELCPITTDGDETRPLSAECDSRVHCNELVGTENNAAKNSDSQDQFTNSETSKEVHCSHLTETSALADKTADIDTESVYV